VTPEKKVDRCSSFLPFFSFRKSESFSSFTSLVLSSSFALEEGLDLAEGKAALSRLSRQSQRSPFSPFWTGGKLEEKERETTSKKKENSMASSSSLKSRPAAAALAWSPLGPYLAAGSAAGAIDVTFSSASSLEVSGKRKEKKK
jgi:hypothetical protein